MHDLNRRTFFGAALIGAGALTVTACGGDSDSSDGSGGGGSGDERKITVQGTSYTVPADPKSVVTLHNACLMPLLDVGGSVAATIEVPESAVPPKHRAAVKKITTFGDAAEQTATAEEILAQDPDLIIAYDRLDPAVLEEVKKVAPTVVVKIDKEFRTKWEERVSGAAAIYDDEAAFDELEKAYADHAAKVKKDHAAALKKVTFSVAASWDQQNFTAYGPSSMIGSILSDAGATFADSVSGDEDQENPGEFEESLEKLGDFLDGDLLLVASSYEGELDETNKALADSPHAKRADLDVHPIGPVTVSCFAQAEFVLDELEKILKDA